MDTAACFAWTQRRERRHLNVVERKHSREMSSFSINAILGTRPYEESERFDAEHLKGDSYPLQKIKARKLTDTDDEDEGV